MTRINVKYRNGNVNRLKVQDGGDWVDLSVAEDVSLEVGEYKILDLGVVIELPDGYEAHIIPRSSTFGKWGILLANSYGLIDNSYCGENDWWGFPALAMRKTEIPAGTRIAQFRLVKQGMNDIYFFGVGKEEWPHKTSRGGFGSTGN